MSSDCSSEEAKIKRASQLVKRKNLTFTVSATRLNCLTHYLVAVFLVFPLELKGLLSYIRMKLAIVKMEDRLSCIQEPALCDGGLSGGIGRSLRMETSTPSCSWTFWKTTAFHTKEELTATTFGCKTTTFAHTRVPHKKKPE